MFIVIVKAKLRIQTRATHSEVEEFGEFMLLYTIISQIFINVCKEGNDVNTRN